MLFLYLNSPPPPPNVPSPTPAPPFPPPSPTPPLPPPMPLLPFANNVELFTNDDDPPLVIDAFPPAATITV